MPLLPPEERLTLADLAIAATLDGEAKPQGVECPDCGCRDLRVVKTRRGEGFVSRRRQCRHCGRRVTTFEQ